MKLDELEKCARLAVSQKKHRKGMLVPADAIEVIALLREAKRLMMPTEKPDPEGYMSDLKKWKDDLAAFEESQ
jgi:hypothetical protein